MGHHHIATCTLHPITFDYCLQALTRQPFAHYYAAASTLTYSRLHMTMQPLAQYHAAACTIPYICLHTTRQLLAHYHATACTLLYSHLHTTMQIEGPSTPQCWEGVPSPGGKGRIWASPTCSRRTSSIILFGPLYKCQSIRST